jgi:hypothetical protein
VGARQAPQHRQRDRARDRAAALEDLLFAQDGPEEDHREEDHAEADERGDDPARLGAEREGLAERRALGDGPRAPEHEAEREELEDRRRGGRGQDEEEEQSV